MQIYHWEKEKFWQMNETDLFTKIFLIPYFWDQQERERKKKKEVSFV